MLLGELLIGQGFLVAEQVEEALAAQVLNGGRIGTNLVELGHLTEAELAAALGAQHGIHFTSGDIVPSTEALASIDLNWADDKDVLPVRIEGNRLYLLLIDPDDIEARDHVAVVTGRRVVPVVIPEFRMAQLQRRYCKAFRPVREVDLEAMRRRRMAKEAPTLEPVADLMNEEDFESLYAAAMIGGDPSGPPAGATEGGGAVEDELPEAELVPFEAPEVPLAPASRAPEHVPPKLASQEAASPETARREGRPFSPATDPQLPERQLATQAHPASEPFSSPAAIPTIALLETEMESEQPGPEPREPSRSARRAQTSVSAEDRPLGFAEAQRALATITDRDDIARIVLRFAAGRFTRAMLLHLEREVAVGWHGAGAGLAPHAVRRAFVPLRKPSAFKLVRDSRSHFLGPLPREDATLGFLEALGPGEPRSAVLMPVLALGRVVDILYCDNGPGQFASPDIGELLILSQKVSRSYESMLAARKARTRDLLAKLRCGR